jgi:hypothetical protein
VNEYGRQIIGDRFVLRAETRLTGGAIFSHQEYGAVGDSVRFMIFADVMTIPATTPLVDIETTIDAVDTAFTVTLTGLTRKHASIAPTMLPAGTYWFSMPGLDVMHIQATTNTVNYYDDGRIWTGITSLVRDVRDGDMFFQLESSVVPEPATLVMWSVLAVIGAGIGFRGKSRN